MLPLFLQLLTEQEVEHCLVECDNDANISVTDAVEHPEGPDIIVVSFLDHADFPGQLAFSRNVDYVLLDLL